MKRGRAEEILEQVQGAILQWQDFAEAVGVRDEASRSIANAQRIDLLP